ncbi:MAG: hypothetical protein K2Q34_01715 [Alphaproteobacteria bacterium]|nr:hypothetical protein [Alphaproteobacteria bacterium]
MSFSVTLYLIGFSGTGKYTIAKELSKFNYKMVDNHLINNPIFSLLDLDGVTPIPEKAWVPVRQIRKIILEFISQDQKSNYIFTNELFEAENDWRVYTQVKETAEKRNSLFIPIKLTLSPEERKKRIINPDRLARFKSTSLTEIHIKKELIKINHPHVLEIDVTNLSPLQAASKILNFVGCIKQ